MGKSKILILGSLVLVLTMFLAPGNSNGFYWSAYGAKVVSLKAPALLKATAVSTRAINLTWEDTNTRETGYIIERSRNESKRFARIATVGHNATLYKDQKSLGASTTYFYRVRAYYQKRKFWPKKYSAYSSIANAKTQSGGTSGGANATEPGSPVAPSPSPSPAPAPATPSPNQPPATPPSPSSVVFAAGGDFGQNSNTAATLTTLAESGTNFFLATGDLSYGDVGGEPAWCNFVTSRVGATYPFQLVAGNHDSEPDPDGHISSFAQCLPDRLNSQGSYGIQYYFDYGNLVRAIMISPDIVVNGVPYDYTVGNPNYTWLSNTIDAARQAGIPWVVVGMHKNCLSMGTKSCEIGGELMNLLIEKDVDLVLQGHDHNYQRSKQLSCATIGSYTSSCVADDGSDGAYLKDAGPIFVIVGTMGNGHYNINPSDSEAGYFANWMGLNANPTFGFVKFTATSSRLDAQFVRAGNGSFTDSFSITGTPSPSPAPAASAPTPPETPPSLPPPPSQESTPPPSPPPAAFIEYFSSYTPNTCFPDNTTFGPWTAIYNGYGCNKITADLSNSADAANSTNQWLDSAPLASSSPSETHATLVVGPSFSGPLTYQVALQTMEQLRTGSPANPWEVGWVVWNYTDNDHFYYFIAKPNGWELGKRDPAYPYNQRFLATGSSPTFPTQSWYTLKITQDAENTINAYVNGVLMTMFTDTERPYNSGRIGLYSEDAHVVFDDVSVIQ